jgi:hypothetical protein
VKRSAPGSPLRSISSRTQWRIRGVNLRNGEVATTMRTKITSLTFQVQLKVVYRLALGHQVCAILVSAIIHMFGSRSLTIYSCVVAILFAAVRANISFQTSRVVSKPIVWPYSCVWKTNWSKVYRHVSEWPGLYTTTTQSRLKING